jgi:hypothetical protein
VQGKPSERLWSGFNELLDDIDLTKQFDDEEIEEMIGEPYQEEDEKITDGRQT